MGAVNFGTSKVITLGVLPYTDADDCFYQGDHVDLYDDDLANVNAIIDNCDFKFFTVEPKPGYYESFYLNIGYDFGDLEDFEENEINAEIDRLKWCLETCAGVGLQACCPGWVTTWFGHMKTMHLIEAAIADLRNSIYEVI